MGMGPSKACIFEASNKYIYQILMFFLFVPLLIGMDPNPKSEAIFVYFSEFVYLLLFVFLNCFN